MTYRVGSPGSSSWCRSEAAESRRSWLRWRLAGSDRAITYANHSDTENTGAARSFLGSRQIVSVRHSFGSTVWLAARSLLWTVLFPGFFAGYLPWKFGLRDVQVSPSDPTQVLGLLLTSAGVVLLVACIGEFARSGRGTLSPVDPPRQLVVRGLYQYVRNPMYLSVTAIVLGEVVLTGSTALAIYWAVWFACVNGFVISYEEPTLRRQFGASYDSLRESRWALDSSSRTPTTGTQESLRTHGALFRIKYLTLERHA